MTHYFTNKQLADTFALIGDLLEIKGEVIYKILAYRKAADTIREHPRPVKDIWREGKLREIPGVGQAIAEKIDELMTTGRLQFLETLRGEVPASLVDLLQVPDLGPKRVAMVWKKLNVTTLEELEQAGRAGKLRDLPGLGEKSEAKILAGIEARKRATGRMSLGSAWLVSQAILRSLRDLPGVRLAESAGSLRRGRATVGDLDFLVGAEDARPIMAAFATLPEVARVIGQGPTKTSVVLENGLQADLRVLAPERFGTALQYFTGSKDHNVRIREIALDRGLSLSEHAYTRVTDGREILCASEVEVYAQLGLAYIPPELREDRGEIQAAREGRLPRLVDVRDLQSDLHSHTTWSDGSLSVHDMAQCAKSRGLKCLAITDHSQSLGIANGLTPERLRQQRLEIDAAQEYLGPGFVLLQGAEVEIRADGGLDYSDPVLDDLDIVVASLHTSLRQERGVVTERLLNAIRNHRVDIIGHPTGRLLPDREGADLDMEVVLNAAAEHGVALEINANPQRLDLDDVYARRALELGCLLAINTDSHHESNFEYAHFGVTTARRSWASSEQIINTWSPEKLMSWLDHRGHGRPAKPVTVEAKRARGNEPTTGTSKKSSAAKRAPQKTASRKAPPAKPTAKRRAPSKK